MSRLRLLVMLVCAAFRLLLPGLTLGCILTVVVWSAPPQTATDKSLPETGEPAFLVPPYLQLPGQTGMTVMWETNQKLPSRVEYGTTTDLDRTVDVPTPTILHEVRLKDLNPGTTYRYRVRSGSITSEVQTFKTAPPPGTSRWRMAVYGDSRTNPVAHRKIVEQIAKANVDLIVHTGDIVTSGKNHQSWRTEFFQPLAPLAGSVPWVSTIGNHENDSDNYFSYMALPGNEHYFGFDYADAHIVCLDSNSWIAKGRDSKQLEWLSAHLKEKRQAAWTFVVFHHPLFSAHATRPINSLRWDWAPVLLDPDNHVDGVLTGHDHFYARNYRMGPASDRPQSGVLFLTTAGGGASLYRSKKRDYVALEKSVHHFTLFEFDGDKVAISAIDRDGIVFDRYVLRKGPAPQEDFCAFEIEELKQTLCKALAVAPAIPVSSNSNTRINRRVVVPTRFRVPLTANLQWESVPGWKMKEARVAFPLQPRQPLEVPLQAEVAAGGYAKSPRLTISFPDGQFRNRTLEVYPFKLAGPDRVMARHTKTPPQIDGKMDEEAWKEAIPLSLLGLPSRGGRCDQVKLLADADWLYVGGVLEDPGVKIPEHPTTSDLEASPLVLLVEHFRLVVSDGKETRLFAVGPEHLRYCRCGKSEDDDTKWRVAADKVPGGWCVEMAIPRKLFSDLNAVRINLVHRRGDAKELVDYELCPTFGQGTNPDRLPDWKSVEAPDRFALLGFE